MRHSSEPVIRAPVSIKALKPLLAIIISNDLISKTSTNRQLITSVLLRMLIIRASEYSSNLQGYNSRGNILDGVPEKPNNCKMNCRNEKILLELIIVYLIGF